MNASGVCICLRSFVLTRFSAESVGVVETLLPYRYNRKTLIFTQKYVQMLHSVSHLHNPTDPLTYLLIDVINTYVSQAGQAAPPLQAESSLIGRLASAPHLHWILRSS